MEWKRFQDEKAKELLELARQSLKQAFLKGDSLHEDLPGEQELVSGVFVTLKLNGKLRGCKGCLEGDYPLAKTIWSVARSSAFEDPRFPMLTKHELHGLEFFISILSPMERVRVKESKEYLYKLRLGIDGVCLRLNNASALFLPEVAPEQGWDVETTLSRLCRKAGLDDKTWLSNLAEVYRFQTQEFSESTK